MIYKSFLVYFIFASVPFHFLYSENQKTPKQEDDLQHYLSVLNKLRKYRPLNRKRFCTFADKSFFNAERFSPVDACVQELKLTSQELKLTSQEFLRKEFKPNSSLPGNIKTRSESLDNAPLFHNLRF